MNVKQAASASVLLAAAGAAVAGGPIVQPLGAPLGAVLGRVGDMLDHPFGLALDSSGSALFAVAAASLAIGIYIVRRKRRD